MKKNLLLLVCNFISMFAVAQNFQTVNSYRNAYFKSANTYKSQINGWHIDSLTVTGNDSVFFNYRVLEHDIYSLANCADGYDTSWTGYKIIIKPNGNNIFFNQFGDSILIKTKANLNDVWTIFNFPNGDKIKATVASVTQQTIFGYTDSVKTISLQAKDNLNNPIANIFNGREIIIGKESGLIKAYNFNLFPADTLSYNLCGISNPDYGVRNITPQEIFNFNVGDTFQYFEQFQPTLPEISFYYTEKVILSKNLFADSVQYDVAQTYYSESYYSGALTTYFSQDTSTETYRFTMPGLINGPFQLYPTSSTPGTLGYATFINDTTYSSRQKKHINENFYYDSASNCVTRTIADCAALEFTYCEGLGMIGFNDPTCIFIHEMNMVYYSNGNQTYGSRFNWSAILGVKNPDNDTRIKVFPNPFSDNLQLNIADKSNQSITVSITDLLGREIFNRHYQNQNHIEMNTSEFKKGIYILNVQTETKSYNHKITK